MKSPITILIVEDEILIAMDWQMQLKQAGYQISGIAPSGEKAFDSIEHLRPDIILMDHGLAGKINGIEAARIIRARYNIPVVFITGYQDQEFFDKIREIEPAACLVKPVTIEKLKAAINSVFV